MILGLPLWAYIVASIVWTLILMRRRKLRRLAATPNAIEGYHRPAKGARF